MATSLIDLAFYIFHDTKPSFTFIASFWSVLKTFYFGK